jgi:putative flippase GtrA
MVAISFGQKRQIGDTHKRTVPTPIRNGAVILIRVMAVPPWDRISRPMISRQFAAFVVVGGVAALVNIVSRLMISRVMPYEAAIVVAYLCGMVTAFFLNRVFVFHAASSQEASRQFARFTLVNIVALAQVWIVGVGLARFVLPAMGFIWHAETVAHVIAVASPILTSYVAHKYFSFAEAAGVAAR